MWRRTLSVRNGFLLVMDAPPGKPSSIVAPALVAAALGARARPLDDAKYPNLKGQRNRIGLAALGRAGPDRRAGAAHGGTSRHPQPDRAHRNAGGQATDPSYICLPPGMPRAMVAYGAMKSRRRRPIVPIDHIHDPHRNFTDGRDWSPYFAINFRGLLDRMKAGSARPRQSDHRQRGHLSRPQQSRGPA